MTMPSAIQRLRHTLTRSRANTLAWLLIVSVVLAGMPVLIVHAHPDAAVGLHHDTSDLHHGHDGAHDEEGRDAQVPATASEAHIHEASTVVLAALQLATLEVSNVRHLVRPPPDLIRRVGLPSLPPQRPPIA